MSTDEARPFDGRVAMVVGASRGIGAATATAFAEAGASVVLASRGGDALEAATEAVAKTGAATLAVATDVGDPAAVERLVAATMERFGRLDAAVNNAADGHMPAPLAEVALEDFERVVRVNLTGFFVAMRHQIPAMLAGGGGAIVNMASTAGLSAFRGLSGYASTKHAIVGLTKVAALDYAKLGVRVNALAPGPILTDRIAALTEEQRAPIVAAVPAGRIGTAREVADAAVWLCSDRAGFITGTTLSIDGGRLAGAA